MNRRLFVFDLDGTLLDSRPTVAKILNHMRVNLGKPEIQEFELTPWLSLGGKSLVSNALGIDQSSDQIDKKIAEFRSNYFEIRHTNDHFYLGALDLVRSLVNAGEMVTLCTNKPRKLVEKILKETDFGKYFDKFCAGGDVNESKPHLSNLIKCKDDFAIEINQMILIGDSTVDQNLSANANIPFFFHQSGYDDGVDIEKTNYYFQRYSEVKPNFKQIIRKKNNE